MGSPELQVLINGPSNAHHFPYGGNKLTLDSGGRWLLINGKRRGGGLFHGRGIKGQLGLAGSGCSDYMVVRRFLSNFVRRTFSSRSTDEMRAAFTCSEGDRWAGSRGCTGSSSPRLLLTAPWAPRSPSPPRMPPPLPRGAGRCRSPRRLQKDLK